MADDFDPDGAAGADSGLFGLPCTPEQARVVVVPVPWEVTTSYRRGTVGAPERVLEASHQVDLFDPSFPDAWRAGIAMEDVDPRIAALNDAACVDALPVIDAGGPGDDPEMHERVRRVDAASHELDVWLTGRISAIFDRGSIPAVLGGDHSVPFGAIREAIRRHPGLGVLHVDAHLDLRVDYLGFRGSHASIMHRVLTEGGLTAALALTPLLFAADAPGKEILHPVAVVIFGGLISATLLDTLLTPLMFLAFGCPALQRLLQDATPENF